MSALNSLNFAKKAPTKAKTGAASPLEKAKKKLLSDINHQIELARDPGYEIITQGRDGSEKRRKPKSWVHGWDGVHDYLTIRYSNKMLPIGGKSGSFIKVPRAEHPSAHVDALEKVKLAVSAGDLDTMLGTAIQKAKRKPRSAAAN